MKFYDKFILPRITNRLCSLGPAMKQRNKVVPQAQGRVLEIGIGSGLNFQFYDSAKVDHLFGLDPSEEMWSIAQRQISLDTIPVAFLKAPAEQIPLDDNTVDSIVITYTLCTIPNVSASLKEMKRVLKPDGHLLFCEHGAAPDESVLKWQNKLNPVWKKFGGGCNLNRDIPGLIKSGGFNITKLETMYIPGPKIASYNYWGIAKPM